MGPALMAVREMVATGGTPKVVVVVLNWNGCEDTLRCLESLSTLDYPNWEALVVDNGSRDGSVVAIRGTYPTVILLEAGKNLGYAGGNNLGIRAALQRNAEFVLLLNNDAVAAPDLLRTLVQAADEHRDAGVFGAKIYLLGDPQRLWYAGTRWDPKAQSFVHIGEGLLDDGAEFAQVQDTEYASGCAMFFRASAADTVGMLDERFFLLFEEVDWCFRARAAGFRCLFVPEAKVWHRVSASFGGRNTALREYFHFRNRLLWAERHLTLWRRIRVWANALSVFFPYLSIGGTLWAVLQGRCGTRQAYWKIRAELKDWRAELRRPGVHLVRAAQWCALRDYLFRRFGDCPSSIRNADDRRAPPQGA